MISGLHQTFLFTFDFLKENEIQRFQLQSENLTHERWKNLQTFAPSGGSGKHHTDSFSMCVRTAGKYRR